MLCSTLASRVGPPSLRTSEPPNRSVVELSDLRTFGPSDVTSLSAGWLCSGRALVALWYFLADTYLTARAGYDPVVGWRSGRSSPPLTRDRPVKDVIRSGRRKCAGSVTRAVAAIADKRAAAPPRPKPVPLAG